MSSPCMGWKFHFSAGTRLCFLFYWHKFEHLYKSLFPTKKKRIFLIKQKWNPPYTPQSNFQSKSCSEEPSSESTLHLQPGVVFSILFSPVTFTVFSLHLAHRLIQTISILVLSLFSLCSLSYCCLLVPFENNNQWHNVWTMSETLVNGKKFSR